MNKAYCNVIPFSFCNIDKQSRYAALGQAGVEKDMDKLLEVVGTDRGQCDMEADSELAGADSQQEVDGTLREEVVGVEPWYPVGGTQR